MNKKWLVITTAAATVALFVVGAMVFKNRSAQQTAQVAQTNSEALVRPHSPVYGNPQAPVTIVEFFDPACETCRAFYPIVKRIVQANFGQVRLVMRYAPLHEGSDQAIAILEAAGKQGKYWEAVERTLALQPQWASHHNPQPALIWQLLADLQLDEAKARADAASPEVAAVLRQDVADMQALQVTKTPGFFVNGEPLREFGEMQLRALVDRHLQKK